MEEETDIRIHEDARGVIIGLLRVVEDDDEAALISLDQTERSPEEWRAIARQAIAMLWDHVGYTRTLPQTMSAWSAWECSPKRFARLGRLKNALRLSGQVGYAPQSDGRL